MKFMTIVKGPESAGFPPQRLIDAIEKLRVEAVEAGTFVDTGGLLPSAAGASVRLDKGKITVTDGPFAEAKELIGGYAIFNLKSKKEAIDAAVRFMELHKKHWPGWEGETEVRQMFDPADFGPPSGKQ
jgi:hypothetical protein